MEKLTLILMKMTCNRSSVYFLRSVNVIIMYNISAGSRKIELLDVAHNKHDKLDKDRLIMSLDKVLNVRFLNSPRIFENCRYCCLNEREQF